MLLRYYEKINKDPMPDDLGRRIRKARLNFPLDRYIAHRMISKQSIQKIVKEKKLITYEKEKPPMYIEDVVILKGNGSTHNRKAAQATADTAMSL